MTGNLPTDFTVRALSNASGSISSSAATASSEGKVDGRTREPSSCSVWAARRESEGRPTVRGCRAI
eukprot:scaffold198540_cov29-Tisochrysis_lutea.AAC.10